MLKELTDDSAANVDHGAKLTGGVTGLSPVEGETSHFCDKCHFFWQKCGFVSDF